jgi:pimeloyl-ACP methyl ester carboxylesterase
VNSVSCWVTSIVLLAWTSHVHAQTIGNEFAIDTERGIDERAYLDIDGVPQYVIIRGQDRSNPVLLYVHGGPGAAASLYAWKYFTRGGWERNFTVVHWDQQGAGKTFERAGKRIDPDLTIERIVDDGIRVSEELARKLNKDKIVVVAGSWGSPIGVRMAKKRPDLFYAYVGTAQVVSPEDEVIAYRQVLEKAQRKKHSRAEAELEREGPPPYKSAAGFRAQRKWASIYENLPATDFQKEVATTPGTVPADLQTWWSGFLASDAHFRGNDLKGPAMTLDVRSWGPAFELPVFFIQGTDDDVTPMSQVRAYFEWIVAPTKRLLPIEGAGHNASTSRSEDFLKLLEEYVRPIAVADANPAGGGDKPPL